MRLHDVCLTIWAASGVLLAVSQIVFIGLALRRKTNAVTTMDLPPGTRISEDPASAPNVVIVVLGAVVLLGIGLFVWILSSMPS